MRLVTACLAGAAACASLVIPTDIAQAANVLANPGMELGLTVGWTQYGRNGEEGWFSYALATLPDPVVNGNNAFKVYAGWNGDPNYNGTYQDVACLPTSIFSATGWFRTKDNDRIVGTYGGGTMADSGNTCWIEVTFRDAANNVLALYKSAVFDGAWEPNIWYLMPVTNQCDIATGLPTNSVTQFAAPTGTTKARYQIVLKQSAWAGAGALWVDDMVLDQISGPAAPTVTDLSPGAILMADAADGLSFTASSSSGTTIEPNGIVVTINGSNVSPDLNITGTDSNKSVTYDGLVSNRVYAVSIQVTDALGLVTTASLNFDTWAPLFVWEGEDYDFLGGQFIDNPILSSTPQANSYFGQFGYLEVDMHETSGEGDKLYRTSDTFATTIAGDQPRQKFLDAQAIDPAIGDYKVGWFNGGEWANYTRTFPSGTYNVYGRLAGGQGAATVNFGKVLSGWGSTEQVVTNLGQFSFVGTGWSTYAYVPLRDSAGNLVTLQLSGTNTLRVTTGGGADVNFLMLVPADTNRPIISAVSPDGLSLLQGRDTFSFNVSSPGAEINNSSIGLVLNGQNVSGQLVITGTANEKTVSYAGLQPNIANYTAAISVTNANGITAGTTVRFDTFSPTAYTWEGEDYDYNSGQFIPDPQTNAYFGLLGTINVDYGELFVNTPVVAYRTSDAMGTDATGDTPRARYAGLTDYNIGWFTKGEWVNYTRQFPAGNVQVWGRFSRGTGTNAAPEFSRVTSGWGTENQTTEPLGTFSVNSQGWGTYQWVPLRDNVGNIVTLSLDGSTNTFRLTSAGPQDNSEVNANFFMLVPAPAASVTLAASLSETTIEIRFPTISGFTYTLQYKNNMTDANWTDLQGAFVAGDGTEKTLSDSSAGSHRFYRLDIR